MWMISISGFKGVLLNSDISKADTFEQSQ
ncbi:hypothetical protein ACHAWO_000694 [Cyclotella atomus]|uniref:Uncharacterized protein n=1 Tax=Cyclotella atomus TaxID=382360 RepID=A0ABD3NT43_9STRA